MRRFLAVLAVSTLVLAACGGDDDGDEVNGETPSTEQRDESGIADPEAEARTATVEYFEALSVLDYSKAMDRSSGSASLVAQWAQSVNDIAEVEGTPYEFLAAPSDEITVSIQSLTDDGDTWTATGFVEMQQRPPGLAEGTLPPELKTPPESWFMTDLTFTRNGDRLRVDDYRLDDSPYPVSELFVDDASVESTVVVDDRDDSNDTTTTGDDLTDDTTTTTDDGPPPPEAEGDPVELYVDTPATDATTTTTGPSDTAADATTTTGPSDGDAADGDSAVEDASDEGQPVLAVRPGAFPGGEGTLRLTYTDATGTAVLVLDLAVPEFPPLNERPVNEVRNARTTTTTSPTTTTSTTASTTTSTTTTTTPDSTVAPTAPAPSPTTAPTTAPETTATLATP